MKPRKVVVVVELWTDRPVKDTKENVKEFFGDELKQIQVNVIK